MLNDDAMKSGGMISVNDKLIDIEQKVSYQYESLIKLKIALNQKDQKINELEKKLESANNVILDIQNTDDANSGHDTPPENCKTNKTTFEKIKSYLPLPSSSVYCYGSNKVERYSFN
jgi:uncharacterized coiled-coil protein SlyX